MHRRMRLTRALNNLTSALSQAKRERAGYTLLELLLVLAIIVIAAAAAAPAMRRSMRNAAVKAAANDVRTALTRAHVMAMKSGRIHVFQYEMNGAKYKIEPWIGDDDALESKDADPSAVMATRAQHTAMREPAIPEETHFALGDTTSTSRGQRVEDELTSSGGSGASWSRPILFYPDGSAADAYVVVANHYDAAIRVDLRGMTCAVRVGQLSDLRRLEQEASSSR
jgi:prepilin-type N-terminal cleavage/methylation domain-containing protein